MQYWTPTLRYETDEQETTSHKSGNPSDGMENYKKLDL